MDGSTLPTLTGNRASRYATFGALYFAQGLPEGLLYIAVPAWLAKSGVDAAAIGSYVAIILIPWSLKLFNGPLMDRWTYLPMGRRRPWVLGAQFFLVLSLLSLTLSPGPAINVALLTISGFFVNFFAAFQDVAIDGMAVDVLPREEHARANGVMWGSKTLGIAASAAASGWVLLIASLDAAAVCIAALIIAVMAFPLFVRERAGERLLPWSTGAASPRAANLQLRGWNDIRRSLSSAVLQMNSLIFMTGIFVAFTAYGLYISSLPLLTVQSLTWAHTDFTDLAAVAGLVGGVAAIVAGGPLTDRIGAMRMARVALFASAALHAGFSMLSPMWIFRPFVSTYVIVFHVLFVLLSISIYASAMRISVARVAATQFALYMAFINLGTSAGAAALGFLKQWYAYPGVIGALAALTVLAGVIFLCVRVPTVADN